MKEDRQSIPEREKIIEEIKQMSDQWPIPIKAGLRLIGQRLDLSWPSFENIVLYLRRHRYITPPVIPYEGKRTQRGLTPEDCWLIESSVLFLRSENALDTSRGNIRSFRLLKAYLESEGINPKLN